MMLRNRQFGEIEFYRCADAVMSIPHTPVITEQDWLPDPVC
jgi:hypothetical protein